MPKQKLKKKLKSEKDQSVDRNSEDDNVSIISSTATSSVYQNDGANSHDEHHDENVRDSIETKLDHSIEGIQEKGYKEREEALKHLIELFRKHYLNNYLIDKKFTLSESLFKCLKRGKLSEQLLALKAIMLTFAQFGYTTPSEDLLHLIYDTLISFVKNDQLEPELRGQCIKTLSLGLFVTIQTDEMNAFMQILEDIYHNADKMLNKLQSLSQFYTATMSSWALMITIMPINYTNGILLKSLQKFELLLENTSDVEFRICIGEAIALLYEKVSGRRDLISNLRKYDSSHLVDIMSSLIKESSKSTSKKDRRTQHSNFRDILKTIEDYNEKVESNGDMNTDSDEAQYNGHDNTKAEFIKVGTQYLYLDTWVRKKQYKAFNDVLSTGMSVHLIENEFLRDMFDLGAPIAVPEYNQKQVKMIKTQRAQINKEEFRYRTKDMNKKRGNRENVRNQLDFEIGVDDAEGDDGDDDAGYS